MQAAGPGATLRHPTPICRCARDPRRREVSAGFACSVARLLGLAFSEPSCVLGGTSLSSLMLFHFKLTGGCCPVCEFPNPPISCLRCASVWAINLLRPVLMLGRAPGSLADELLANGDPDQPLNSLWDRRPVSMCFPTESTGVRTRCAICAHVRLTPSPSLLILSTYDTTVREPGHAHRLSQPARIRRSVRGCAVRKIGRPGAHARNPPLRRKRVIGRGPARALECGARARGSTTPRRRRRFGSSKLGAGSQVGVGLGPGTGVGGKA